MKVEVLYFAALREGLGREREALELPAGVRTAGALRRWMQTRGEPFATQFASGRLLRVAVARVMAEEATALSEGCEVAFFPPVTGG
jgi:molybdopterin synthase sulfur carrier subunit